MSQPKHIEEGVAWYWCSDCAKFWVCSTYPYNHMSRRPCSDFEEEV